MRNFILVLALVGAFQAGRLMPVRTAWWTQPQPSTAYAQLPPETDDHAAFAELIAYETLMQLEARAPAVAEALRLEQAELAALIQERLGPDVEQLKGQAATAQDVLTRSQALLDRSDSMINRSYELIDDSNNTLDDSRDLLDDTESVMDDSEQMLSDSRDSLDRSTQLMQDAEVLMQEAAALGELYARDIEDLKTIFDICPAP